ncbi:hypothetical protein ACIF8W_28315 [Streptomyces sp. NPDC085639]|uniref:hypothetical protein n=1 Tax=Streptomyces sp. NPDC085639 TaxID=3365734 RepID=UPI0037D6ECC1
MQSDDKPVNGQHAPNTPNFFDLLDQATPPPVTGPDKAPGTNLTQLRAAWNASWEQGGFLHGRWEELRQIPQAGWHGMANWIKGLLILTGMCAVIILLDTAGDVFDAALGRLADALPATQVGASASDEFWGVLDNPIRTYIAAHSAALPISASTVYIVWQLVGLFGLIGGFTGSSGARITWTAWGAASIAMVHSATPVEGRTIATGVAVLAWSAASAFALRGLTLRPAFVTYIHYAGIEPHIHLPAPDAPEADETPDNVHPLQKH